jgi:hypothetical protein
MDMGRDSLPGFDMPCDDDSLLSFDDHRSNGLATRWLQEISTLKNSIDRHDALV